MSPPDPRVTKTVSMKYGVCLLGAFTVARAHQSPSSPYCPILYEAVPSDCEPIRASFSNFSRFEFEESASAGLDVFEDTFDALLALQQEYYSPDYGTWPTAIDWTAAVAQTLVTGCLTTLSKSLDNIDLGGVNDWKAKENLISSLYDQVVGSYFSQDVLSIRGQAYDDILWVVLGWLEAIKFVTTHSGLHYPRPVETWIPKRGLREILETMPWHGHSWMSSFSHRARIFWNVASHGWDTKLCHGGMNWNPRLNPYKNAITNELWIAASISMYQYFPGDNFTAPWLASAVFPDKDPAHLAAAVEGHKWLMGINMTNSRGLFVDGYHIDFRKPGNTECDMRDEMVYTYNQGVILTGLGELWSVSGASSYLQEGHDLIHAVIGATGWSLQNNTTIDDLGFFLHKRNLPPWHGLGRGGVLEERCDASGTCSQDGQTFKGIFFHHLTAFCGFVEPLTTKHGSMIDVEAHERVRLSHSNACRSYLSWVRHNSVAALQTRDTQGRFGMWWGASLFGNLAMTRDHDGTGHSAENTTDYRNYGTSSDDNWGPNSRWLPGSLEDSTVHEDALVSSSSGQHLLGGDRRSDTRRRTRTQFGENSTDPNKRGRGRTVETQIGGLALLRAYWEMSQSASI